ncbi:hypothetical protein [Marinomonas piezotolerans]|nr:hypothetical protein [Marinomonas piezotolerans]
MKELRIANVEEVLGHVFDEIERLSYQCQFFDCKHKNEPGCAVLAAVEAGQVCDRLLGVGRASQLLIKRLTSKVIIGHIVL